MAATKVHITLDQAKTIANAVLNKVSSKGYLTSVDDYTITKAATADSGYSATYQLFKGSTAVGDKINIPKDMVVESGSVKTCETADTPVTGYAVGDKYIDLVLANAASSHIYILVSDLVDTYTNGNGLNLSNNTFSIKVASTGANGLSVDTDGLKLGVATDSAAGAMSAADHTKLTGIEAGAQANTVTGVKGSAETNYRTGDIEITATNIGLGNVTNNAQVKGLASGTTSGHVVTWGSDGYTVADSGYTIAKSVPADAVFTDTTYSEATSSAAGLMSSTDKSKLDDITTATDAEVTAMIATLDTL